METITIALAISVLGIVLNVFNFYYARKKETITNVKEQLVEELDNLKRRL